MFSPPGKIWLGETFDIAISHTIEALPESCLGTSFRSPGNPVRLGLQNKFPKDFER
jgi:hypothetical protein